STEALQKRVIYAYNQACMPLRFYPEIWIEFADYLWSIGQRDEALPKMRDACDVLPTSLSVHFTYAEMAEKLKQTTKCKQIYDRVVNTARSEIDNTTSKYTGRLDKLNRKLRELSSPDIHNQGSAGAAEAESQVEQLDEILSEPESGLDDVSDSMSVAEDDKLDRAEPEGSGQQPASQSSTNKLKRSIERRISKVRQRMDASLSEQRETYTLAWIMYLRFVRRSEGIDAARQLLRRPRSDPPGYLTYHLFVAAAQMEYHVGKRADVAGRLFEYYSKNYSDQKDYILHYLRFLIDSSNDSNARALFERFHNQSVGDTKEMWDLFADYEYNYGDISSITNLDKRYIDKFSDETAITRISAKYSYLDMESVSLRDFGLNHRYGGRGADMPRRHVGSEQAGEDENYRPRGDLPASAGQLGGIHNVGVGSITGRSLNKRQLMAPVRSSRFAKPLVADLEVYAPTIEPMPEPTPEAAAAGALGMGPANPGTVSPYQRLLNSGDVLSYAASSLAASSTSEFDGYPLDTDALLDALMSSPVPGPLASSDYRPLEYLITLKRQRFQQPSGFDGPHSRREKAGGLEVGGRARARGNDLPPGHRSHAHPSKHPRSGSSSRGAHRQAPYARSPVYSRNDSRSRSPYRGSRNSGRGGH
ncbi:mRNA 3'-end-processing protein rna14, partial [Dipsacomyces acuminosporus]